MRYYYDPPTTNKELVARLELSANKTQLISRTRCCYRSCWFEMLTRYSRYVVRLEQNGQLCTCDPLWSNVTNEVLLLGENIEPVIHQLFYEVKERAFLSWVLSPAMNRFIDSIKTIPTMNWSSGVTRCNTSFTYREICLCKKDLYQSLQSDSVTPLHACGSGKCDIKSILLMQNHCYWMSCYLTLLHRFSQTCKCILAV